MHPSVHGNLTPPQSVKYAWPGYRPDYRYGYPGTGPTGDVRVTTPSATDHLMTRRRRPTASPRPRQTIPTATARSSQNRTYRYGTGIWVSQIPNVDDYDDCTGTGKVYCTCTVAGTGTGTVTFQAPCRLVLPAGLHAGGGARRSSVRLGTDAADVASRAEKGRGASPSRRDPRSPSYRGSWNLGKAPNAHRGGSRPALRYDVPRL